eukprot:680358-Pyramimonas_sp.AAC.1
MKLSPPQGPGGIGQRPARLKTVASVLIIFNLRLTSLHVETTDKLERHSRGHSPEGPPSLGRGNSN